MEMHELEVEIGPTGTVMVHVNGLRGPECEKYVELFSKLLHNKANHVQRTTDFYEPPSGIRIDVRQHA